MVLLVSIPHAIPLVLFYGDAYQNSTHPVLFSLLHFFEQMAHGNTMRLDANGYGSGDDGILIVTRSSFNSADTVLYDRIRSWHHRVSSPEALFYKRRPTTRSLFNLKRTQGVNCRKERQPDEDS